MIDLIKYKKDALDNYIPLLSDECEKVLIDLLKQKNIQKVLEIGTCIGYSSLIMLLNSDCTVDTIEIDEKRQEKAKALWKDYNVLDRINSYLGDANQILEDVIKDKMYDFIFLDGPKSWYLRQFNTVFDNLKSGGIILADDVLFFGLVEGPERVPHKHRTIVRHLREFLSELRKNDKINLQLINKGNGIAIIEKK